MKVRWRRVARVVGIAVAAIAGLALIGLGFLHTPWGKDFVRGRIERAIGASVDGTVRVGSIDYTLLFGAIRIGDVEIREASGRPAIRIAEVAVELDRTSALGKEPVIEALAVRGVAVSVVRAADGATNLAALFAPAARREGTLARLRIERFALDGAIEVAAADGATIAITGVDVRGAVDARIAAKQLDLALGPIAADVAIARPGEAARSIAVRVGGATVARTEAGVDVRIDGAEAGPLAIESVVAHVGLGGAAGAGGGAEGRGAGAAGGGGGAGVDGLGAGAAGGGGGAEGRGASTGAGGLVKRLAGEQRVAVRGARVDRAKLAALVGRDVLAADLALEATLAGPLDRLVLDGTVRAGTARVVLEGAADLAAARPTYRVRLAGDGLRAKQLVRTEAVPDVAGELRVEVRGAGVAAGDREASLELSVRALAAALTGKATLAADRTVHATVELGAAPAEVIAAATAAGIAVPPDVARLAERLPPRLELRARADGELDRTLAIELAPARFAVGAGRVELGGSATLEALQPRTVSARVVATAIDLAPLAALAGRGPAPVRGTLGGTLELQQRLGGELRADYEVAVALVQPSMQVAVRGRADGATAGVQARFARGAQRLATIDATLPIAARGGTLGLRLDAPWRIVISVPPGDTAEFARLLPAALRALVPRGSLEVRVEVAGTPRQPSGRLALGFAEPGGARRADVTGTFATTAAGTVITTTSAVTVATATTSTAEATAPAAGAPAAATTPAAGAPPAPVVTVRTTIALPPVRDAHALALALRRDTRLDATIELPARPLASLAQLDPALAALDETVASLGGTVGGRVVVTGAMHAPSFEASLQWDGYRTAAGTVARSELRATGTAAGLDVKLVHGDAAHRDAVVVTARVDRRDNDRFAIAGALRAEGVPLVAVLPAVAARYLGAVDTGQVRSDLAGRAVVHRAPGGGVILDETEITGALAITGASLPIPDSDRRYRDVELTLTAGARGVEVAARGHERDLEKQDRRLEARGLLAFVDRRPAKLELALSARDWLVFGGGYGPAAAPQATLDGDFTLRADLAAPVLGVELTVDRLALDAPDRGDIFLYPKSLTGDLIELAPGEVAGRLPITIANTAAPRRNLPMNIAIHIPRPVRIRQGPLDVTTRGDLAIQVREGSVATRGGLAIDRGALSFFGERFELVRGRLEFSDAHPAGWMALELERRLPDSTMRDLAKTPASSRARISLTGPLARTQIAFAGATNSEFADVVAVSNLGHGRLVTGAGLAASQSVQAPHGERLLMTAFFAMLVPRLLFLDRLAAWSDPADGGYGKIQHVEADRYVAGDRARVRAVARPPAPGRSTAEVHVDRLLRLDDTTAAGIGLRAGDRIGGGVGVFVEWSSAR